VRKLTIATIKYTSLLALTSTEINAQSYPERAQTSFSALQMTKSCTECDFSEQSLPMANFSEVQLRRSYFIETNLQGASFEKAYMISVCFPNSDLRGVNFSYSHLDTEICRKNIDGAPYFSSFEKSDIRGANFTKAKISAEFINSALDGTNFSHAELNEVTFYLSQLNNAKFIGASGKYGYGDLRLIGKFNNLDFSFARLHITSYCNGFIEDYDVVGQYGWCNRRDSNREIAITNSQFLSAQLGGSNFAGADLTGSNFQGANLVEVNFTNSNLTDVNLFSTDLTGATLNGAVLCNTTAPDGTVMYDGC
jgi:uncharacterized protein YjbI with pentapeptide repeats